MIKFTKLALIFIAYCWTSASLAQQPNGTINAPIYATGYITQVGGAAVTTRIPAQPNHPTNLNIYAGGAITTWTIALPNPAFEGQQLTFSCSATVTNVVVQSSDGSSLDPNIPVYCAANSGFSIQFDQRSNIWRNLGYFNTTSIVAAQLPAFVGGDCTSPAGSSMLACAYLPGGTGAVSRGMPDKFRELSVSVIDYAADPTGATDSKPAVQKAVDYVSTFANGGKVTIPKTNAFYRFDSSVLVTHDNVTIECEARGTLIKSASTNTDSVFKFDAGGTSQIKRPTVKNCDIQTLNDSTIGLFFIRAIEPAVEDVYILSNQTTTNVGSGVYMYADTNWAGGLRIDGSRIVGFKYGVYLSGTSSPYPVTASTISRSWLLGQAGISGSVGVLLNAFAFDGNVICCGNDIEGWAYGVYEASAGANTIIGNRLESNTSDVTVTQSGSRTYIGFNTSTNDPISITYPAGAKLTIMEKGLTYVGPTFNTDPIVRYSGQQAAGGPYIGLQNSYESTSRDLLFAQALGGSANNPFTGSGLAAALAAIGGDTTNFAFGTKTSGTVGWYSSGALRLTDNGSGAFAFQTGARVQLADQGSCTMTAGVCSAQALGSTYSSAPNCYGSWTGTGALAGALKMPSTTTTVTPTSSNAADTAQIKWVCFGN